MIECPKCKNTGDIILIESLCWCPCGHHWILLNKPEAPKIVAAFTCNAGQNIVIRLTAEKYNGESIITIKK